MNQLIGPATLDLVDRVSRRSEVASERPSQYQDHATPSTGYDLPELKPRDAPPVVLADRRWAGLVVHSVAIGVVSTVLPLSVYPFLTAYSNMEGTQTLSARALLVLPWVLRPFLRMVMDCTPAWRGARYRRFVVLGWAVAAAALCAIFAIEIPDPFFPHHTMKPKPLQRLSPQELASLNTEAPARGAIYVMLMAVTTVGYVVADVAADALVEQIDALHFPSLESGVDSPFVEALTTKRLLAMLGSFLFMGFAMSGVDYGGDFDFTLSYNQLMLVFGVVAALPIPFALGAIQELATKRGVFAESLSAMWTIVHHRGLNLIVGCRFLGGILGGVSATPVSPIAYYWAGVQPLNDNVVSFVATVAVIGGIHYAEKKGWALDHLRLIILANIAVLVVDSLLSMATIWNVVRTQWLWIGLPVMESLPSAVEFLILNVIIGEIAEPDAKDLTRQLVMAVSFLAGSLGVVVTKLIDAPFHVANDDILRDTQNVRADATAVFLIAYAAQLLSLAWMCVLPRHGNAAREWKLRHRVPSTPLACLLVGVLLVGFLGSVAVHVLSINASTSCLWIAGGNGCE